LHEGSGVKVTMVQLPALNTPQFDVSRSRMPRRAKPVPPIYEPEVAADAIVWAAFHPRREHSVGGSTVAVILGERLSPALGDRYLARTGYEAQQTAEPEGDRPDSLFDPVPGDRGAHGRFDAESRARSLQWMLVKHRSTLVLAGGVLLAALSRR
jgi:hypothetical protein